MSFNQNPDGSKTGNCATGHCLYIEGEEVVEQRDPRGNIIKSRPRWFCSNCGREFIPKDMAYEAVKEQHQR